MPTFLAFHKGEKVGECVGADLGKIGQLIEKYASLSVSQPMPVDLLPPTVLPGPMPCSPSHLLEN